MYKILLTILLGLSSCQEREKIKDEVEMITLELADEIIKDELEELKK